MSAPAPAASLAPETFDFDAWRRLAVEDPQAFFARRQAAIEACIASHPNPAGRAQMRHLQDQIDGMRLVAGGPERALQGIATMLTDHLHALTANLTELGEETRRLSGLLRQVQTSRPNGV